MDSERRIGFGTENWVKPEILDETCEEDEVFFGAVTEQEIQKSLKFCHRRTEFISLPKKNDQYTKSDKIRRPNIGAEECTLSCNVGEEGDKSPAERVGCEVGSPLKNNGSQNKEKTTLTKQSSIEDIFAEDLKILSESGIGVDCSLDSLDNLNSDAMANDKGLSNRDSYFSSLKVINVNNDKLFNRFIIEEAHKDHNSGICDLTETTNSPSHDIQNNHKTLKVDDVNQSGSQLAKENDDVNQSSSQLAKENDDVNQSGSQLAKENEESNVENDVYNDTVEEMELLLKYGIEYFEKDTMEQTVPVSQLKSEHPVCKQEKIKLDCSELALSFVPNLDSTRASAEFTKPPAPNGNNLNRGLSPKCSLRKEAPPKPPRNMKPPSPSSCSVLKSTQRPSPSKLTESREKIVSVQKAPFTLCTKTHAIISPCVSRGNITPRSAPKGKVFATPNLRPIMDVRKGCWTPTNKISPVGTNFATPKTASVGRLRFLSNTVCIKKGVKSAIPPKPFFSPQTKMKHQVPKQVVGCGYKKVGGLDIISPVAKYLQENPPPPLITTVKARYQISPLKMGSALNCQDIHKGESSEKIVKELNASVIQREESLQRINQDLQKLNLKMNPKVSKYVNDGVLTPRSGMSIPPTFLPKSVYHQGSSVHLPNKENTCKRREIPVDKPPSSILRHKGRMHILKETESFMEVSVYESADVHHTNTLK